MGISYRKWLSISFINLLIVAILGVLMRYKIAFYLPYIHQKDVLHSHSHFAFAGWITQTFMVLLVHNLSTNNADQVIKKYNWLLYANCITAYGMLVAFFIQGYGLYSITFSTLSIFVSYYFAVQYWKDLNKQTEKKASHLWIKASLVFSVISSLGAFSLAYMMVNKVMVQNWQLASVYFFLHFQYNGWFLFAGMGLLVSKLEMVKANIQNMKNAFYLFCFACVPAYLLSVLWLPIPQLIYIIIILAVIAQVVGWVIMIRVIKKSKLFIQEHFSKYGCILLLLSAIAFTIKLILQTGSVHPALSQLSYGFRPIIIGYLHLVLLAITSIFIIGYIVSFDLIAVTKKIKMGISIFVIGIILNEILLMLQGVAALSYNTVPYIDGLLLATAVVLFIGIFLMVISSKKSGIFA
jgi:hypothetical protein